MSPAGNFRQPLRRRLKAMTATLPPTAPPASPAPPIPPAAPPRDDATRAAELAAMKRVANGLLVVAALVYVVARWFERTHPWAGVIRAMAEASVVGGLADWFAVTALFRRPLGLPIPHTAIIPTQKDRIGRILGNFLQNHFLSRDVLASKLAGMRVAERVARWLADPGNARRLARHAAVGLTQTLEALPEEEVRAFIRRNAVARLQAAPLAPMLGNVLTVVATDDRHQALLDEALRLVGDAIEKNGELIRARIRDESPWWVPGKVDDALYQRAVSGAQRLLQEVRADPAHPIRQRFDAAFRRFVERLKSEPEVMARAEALKEGLLDPAAVEDFAIALWDRARGAAGRLATEPGEGALEPIARGIAAVGESLLADDAKRAELDRFITDFIATLLEQHRHEVADLIAITVRQWDPALASRRIELAVGRDLQFIRLNGTVVGGLAGLAIYLVSLLFR